MPFPISSPGAPGAVRAACFGVLLITALSWGAALPGASVPAMLVLVLCGGVALASIALAPARPLRSLAACCLAVVLALAAGAGLAVVFSLAWCVFFAGAALASMPVLSGAAAGAAWLGTLIVSAPRPLLVTFVLLSASFGAGVLAAHGRRAALRAERQRIAQELHDGLGHALVLIRARAGTARFIDEAGESRTALRAIEAGAGKALDELRHVVSVIDPGEDARALRPAPSLAAVIDAARAAGLRVELEGTLPCPPGDPAREQLCRIVAEALSNVLRHAAEPSCRLTVTRHAGGWVRLELSNPAGPASRRPGAGRGLRGIERRARRLGGSAAWDIAQGRFRLVLRVREA